MSESNPASRPDSRASQPNSTHLGDSTTSHSNTSDWSVEYNLEVDKTFEVDLTRTIMNKRGMACIKFSPDGQLLAVLVRRGEIVVIYNVAVGTKIWQVLRNHLNKIADVCISELEDPSVRKSPPETYDLNFNSNGKYLATHTLSQDSRIRVSLSLYTFSTPSYRPDLGCW
jgi:WD40 repeat protein